MFSCAEQDQGRSSVFIWPGWRPGLTGALIQACSNDISLPVLEKHQQVCPSVQLCPCSSSVIQPRPGFLLPRWSAHSMSRLRTTPWMMAGLGRGLRVPGSKQVDSGLSFPLPCFSVSFIFFSYLHPTRSFPCTRPASTAFVLALSSLQTSLAKELSREEKLGSVAIF